MSRGDKLGVLLKASQATEHEALQVSKKIDDVVEQRRRALEMLEVKMKELEATISSLNGKDTQQALRCGDVTRVSSISSFTKRLQSELDTAQVAIKRRTEELQRAIERLTLAKEDSLNASVERKKIQQLIAKKEKQRQVSERVKEELDQDEMQGRRNRGS